MYNSIGIVSGKWPYKLVKRAYVVVNKPIRGKMLKDRFGVIITLGCERLDTIVNGYHVCNGLSNKEDKKVAVTRVDLLFSSN